jgi:hypothetical protein
MWLHRGRAALTTQAGLALKLTDTEKHLGFSADGLVLQNGWARAAAEPLMQDKLLSPRRISWYKCTKTSRIDPELDLAGLDANQGLQSN